MTPPPGDRPAPLVLTIDDDRSQRLTVRHVLTREGYRVEDRADAREALARLAEAPAPDLILLDAILPDQNGFEVCRQLRLLPGCAEIPVLMITSLDDVAAIDQAFRCGVTDFINKPIHWPIFRQRVRRLALVGHARQELESTQARARAVVDRIAEAVLIEDQHGNLESINPAGAKLFGSAAEGLVGLPVGHLFDGELPAGDGDGAVPIHARRPDGTRVPVELSVSAASHWTRDFRVLVLRDVSARRRAEQERREVEERLRRAGHLETLSRLSGGIAHDLNSKLTAVIGFAEIARKEAAPHPALDQIRAAAEEAQRLVRRMLTYAGRDETALAPLDLAALARKVAGPGRRPGDPVSEVPAEPLWVSGDAAQLEQVLAELLRNAAEAGAPVRLRLGRERLTRADLRTAAFGQELPEGEYAFAEVSDEGEGIAADDLPRLFEPFFTTRSLGRGLGLSAALGILTAHRGTVRVESTPGEGAAFRVWLPLLPDSPPPAGEVPGPLPARVLVADDDQTVLRVVAAHLQRAGVGSRAAANGLEAVELFRAAPGDFDAVLIDLNMPVMDGEQAIAAIRAHSPERAGGGDDRLRPGQPAGPPARPGGQRGDPQAVHRRAVAAGTGPGQGLSRRLARGQTAGAGFFFSNASSIGAKALVERHRLLLQQVQQRPDRLDRQALVGQDVLLK